MKNLSSFIHDIIPAGPELLLKPVLSFVLSTITQKYPEIFERLGEYQKKRFLINPTDMPFVFLLMPDSRAPAILPYKNKEDVSFDAAISGTFLKLKDLIDGKLDGDALFFSRDLTIEGDTEAVLALRNAIDDVDLDLIEEIKSALGPLGIPLQFAKLGINKGFEQMKGSFST